MKTQLASLSILFTGAISAVAHPGHGSIEHQVSSVSPIWWVAAIGMLVVGFPLVLKFLRK